MAKRGAMRRKDILVALVCGCTLRMFERPRNPNSRFACTSNLGHGYSVGWKSWSDLDDNSFFGMNEERTA